MSHLFNYLVNGGDELAEAKASIEHLSGCLGSELDENAKLQAEVDRLNARIERLLNDVCPVCGSPVSQSTD